jgi:hypothetical protein
MQQGRCLRLDPVELRPAWWHAISIYAKQEQVDSIAVPVDDSFNRIPVQRVPDATQARLVTHIDGCPPLP